MQWMLSLKSVLHIKVMEIGVSLSEILKENFLPGEEGGGASKKTFSPGRKEGSLLPCYYSQTSALPGVSGVLSLTEMFIPLLIEDFTHLHIHLFCKRLWVHDGIRAHTGWEQRRGLGRSPCSPGTPCLVEQRHAP